MGSEAAAAAAAAALAQAIKASGAIVNVKPEDFEKLLNRNPNGLVVHSLNGLFRFSKTHSYLMSYKGLAFYTRSREALILPGSCEVVEAGKIWIPG